MIVTTLSCNYFTDSELLSCIDMFEEDINGIWLALSTIIFNHSRHFYQRSNIDTSEKDFVSRWTILKSLLFKYVNNFDSISYTSTFKDDVD